MSAAPVSLLKPFPRRLVVLGSSGSIGTNCLDVVAALCGKVQVLGLSAHRRRKELFAQARQFNARWVTLTGEPSVYSADADELPAGCELRLGEDGVAEMVSDPEVDIVLNAIVGAAGLRGSWVALTEGKTVALANKETLVVAGPLIAEAALASGSQVIPVDSEHSAIFQAMHAGQNNEVKRVVLTASGGPFRGCSAADLMDVTAEDALQHPTWRMGRKISVDSATLMNKALEIVEARWLFGLQPEQIEVIIHPESIVHSFVEFVDGSVIAQLSPPDMRLPIQYALTYPERLPGPCHKLCWSELQTLHFEQPDTETFPSLELGYEVARQGGTCGAVLNAANEAAVARFLAGELPFLEIGRVCREVLSYHNYSPKPELAELLAVDRWARQEVANWNTSPT